MVEDAETLNKYAGIISDKSVVLEERISSLIDFARMETGEWKLRNRVIELNSFLERLSAVYKEDCEILNKLYRYENTLPEKAEVTCDPVLFERALENLFVNSVKHTLSGTEIYLRVFLEKGVPVIELGDNGGGIGDDDLRYIFEPFYRGSNSRREPGMGLGLSTTKSVLDAHGWEVSVSSEKGVGTVFRIVLSSK
jgi:signal transduction histidine kinase